MPSAKQATTSEAATSAPAKEKEKDEEKKWGRGETFNSGSSSKLKLFIDSNSVYTLHFPVNHVKQSVLICGGTDWWGL